MFLALFLLWVILNGRLTGEIAVLGAGVSAVCYVFFCRLCGTGLDLDLRLMKKLPTVLRLFGVLLAEIVKANWRVIRWVYHPKHTLEPEIVQFEADLHSEAARVALAQCITLTPGTITGRLEGNVYTVHCLDKSMAEGLDQSAFVEILRELEKTGGEEHDV